MRARRSLTDADELTHFAHELANLIDGSLRWISLASADLPVWAEAPDALERARTQIERVRGNLERMSGLVSAAMRSGAVPIGSPLLAAGSGVTVAEAIDHAIDVVRSETSGSGVEITLDLCPVAGRTPAGPVYAAVLNGIRNAAESVEAAAHVCGRTGGAVRVSARGEQRDASAWVVVRIEDNGPGVREELTAGRAFEHGVSTKGRGRGVGLSLARRIIEEMGGTVELGNQSGATACGCEGAPGAVLTLTFPSPIDPGSVG